MVLRGCFSALLAVSYGYRIGVKLNIMNMNKIKTKIKARTAERHGFSKWVDALALPIAKNESEYG